MEERKITISRDNYERILRALNIAADREQQFDPEINWYAEAYDDMVFAWSYCS